MDSYNERYFYLGGAMSLAISAATVMLFAWGVLNTSFPKSYALEKSDYISVSIDLPTLKRPVKEKTAPKSVDTPSAEPTPVAQEKPQTSAPVVEDISTLFDDVWTKDVTAKKKVVKPQQESKRIGALETRLKTSKSEKSSKAAEQIEALKLAKPSVSVVGSSASAAAEVNKYYAKIQAIIYDRFYPPANSEGQSAKLYLRFDGKGTLLDARILAASGNPLFDDEVRALIKRLDGVAFPETPEGAGTEIQIIVTAEE